MKITIDLSVKEFEELKSLMFSKEKYDGNINTDRSKIRSYYNDNMVFGDRCEVEHVLDLMFDWASSHGGVSVEEYKAIIGLDADYTDYEYGWTESEIKAAQISRTRDGYRIVLPAPKPLPN